MKRVKLSKPIKIERNGTEITINYEVKSTALKKADPKKMIRKLKNMNNKTQKGGGMDMDEDDEEEGIYTGYYNIIAFDTILHTDYFLLPEEKPEKWIIKNIFKKHKKEFKKQGIKNFSIEIFDTMFYPREEGPKAVKEALEAQLPIIATEVSKLSKSEIKQKKKDAFDLSELGNLLDKM